MNKLIGLAFALVLLTAGPAFAHVTADPGAVTAGGFAVVTFRVPNESDEASTVELEIVFPEDAPFDDARTKPVPGWEAAIEHDGNRVSSITWTGGEIGPGEFQEFPVSLGPIPDVGSLVFGAVQTDSDGEVVRWIETEEDAEHPAPTVTVDPASGGEHGRDAGTGEAEPDGTEPVSAGAGIDPNDDAENGTDPAAFVALFLGGAALVAAVAALVIGRRRPSAV